MTNFEKYGKDIIVGLINEHECGINAKNGELIDCNSKYIEDCDKCLFNGECRVEEKIRNWLDTEYYEVDWSKVPIDTKVLVSSDGVTWYKRYFAGVLCKTGCPQVFANGADNWSNSLTESWKYIKLYKEYEE